MAKTQIKNRGPGAFGLPAPYSGMLGPGDSAVLSDTPDQFIANMGGVAFVESIVDITQISEGNQTTLHNRRTVPLSTGTNGDVLTIVGGEPAFVAPVSGVGGGGTGGTVPRWAGVGASTTLEDGSLVDSGTDVSPTVADDNLISLGLFDRRIARIHVGPGDNNDPPNGAIVVHFDNTDTLKTLIGYSSGGFSVYSDSSSISIFTEATLELHGADAINLSGDVFTAAAGGDMTWSSGSSFARFNTALGSEFRTTGALAKATIGSNTAAFGEALLFAHLTIEKWRVERTQPANHLLTKDASGNIYIDLDPAGAATFQAPLTDLTLSAPAGIATLTSPTQIDITTTDPAGGIITLQDSFSGASFVVDGTGPSITANLGTEFITIDPLPLIQVKSFFSGGDWGLLIDPSGNNVALTASNGGPVSEIGVNTNNISMSAPVIVLSATIGGTIRAEVDGDGWRVDASGNFVPSVSGSPSDNTLDIGAFDNRIKTIHVGEGSVVVHGDDTDTNKMVLGYTLGGTITVPFQNLTLETDDPAGGIITLQDTFSGAFVSLDGGGNTIHLSLNNDDDEILLNTNNIQLVTTQGSAAVVRLTSAGTPHVRISTANNTYSVQLDDDGLLEIGAINTIIDSGLAVRRTGVADINFTATENDHIIAYTSITAARMVTLPTPSFDGQEFIVKDESGGASAANSITIVGAGGETFDGAADAVINSAYGVFRLYTDGANYFTY